MKRTRKTRKTNMIMVAEEAEAGAAETKREETMMGLPKATMVVTDQSWSRELYRNECWCTG